MVLSQAGPPLRLRRSYGDELAIVRRCYKVMSPLAKLIYTSMFFWLWFICENYGFWMSVVDICRYIKIDHGVYIYIYTHIYIYINPLNISLSLEGQPPPRFDRARMEGLQAARAEVH